ncbi:hypothetical protein AA958_23450 [Streptomyces sp. CNQ-509]|uniref:hypothetical protein n=1 Tax=unclassified Streptomyces TaxID=2593676 RepID=UPI00062E0274|nr:hypothetical protein [Streptomyces sp. CNQ-509]AKH84671.1 hypothetical protein AA958_23450 [Streptomyces sp. CNQ-509]
MRKSVVAAALVSALGVTVLSACGSEDSGLAGKSPEEIKDETVAAMRSAKSMTLDFQQTGAAGTAMKLSVTKGGECTGSVTTQGATAEIRRAGGTSYMKPDTKFWEQNAGSPEQAQLIEATVGDRWVEMGAGQDDFASFCDLDTILKDMDDEDKGDGDKGGRKDTTEKGDEGEVRGTPTITLIAKEDGETTRVHIATEGEPYILKMEMEDGDQPGTAEFSEFNEKVDVTAPADAVNLNELGG